MFAGGTASQPTTIARVALEALLKKFEAVKSPPVR